MLYLFSYLSLGMFFVVLKSPIRRLVDWEVADLEMNCRINDREVPTVKLVLLRFILSLIVVALYPVILFRKISHHYNKYTLEALLRDQRVEADPSWLRDEISIADAEADNVVRIEGRAIPFGKNNGQWNIILQLMQEGDRLFTFRSPDDTWGNYTGKEGVALVRNGAIISDIVKLLD